MGSPPAATFEVKRIGIVSALRISFFLSWAAGAVLAIVYGLLFLFASRFNPESFDAQLQELGVGTSGIVFVLLGGFFLSILCALLGAAGTAVFVLLYNGLARVIGGVSLDLGGAISHVSTVPDRPAEPSASHPRPEPTSDPNGDPDRGSVQ